MGRGSVAVSARESGQRNCGCVSERYYQLCVACCLSVGQFERFDSRAVVVEWA